MDYRGVGGGGSGRRLPKAPPLSSSPLLRTPTPPPLCSCYARGRGRLPRSTPAVGLGAGPRKCGGLDLKESFRGLHPDPVCPPRRRCRPPRRGLPPAYQWALASGGV